MISIQPEPLHSEQSEPFFLPEASQAKQDTSTSTLGSVNGKYPARSRTRWRLPKIARANSCSVPCRSASVIRSSTASPSTCVNMGVCVASESRR
jgi:hypothetical protein